MRQARDRIRERRESSDYRWPGPPPFHRDDWPPHPRMHRKWGRRPRRLFLRFMLIFGLLSLLLTGGMASVITLIVRLLGGETGVGRLAFVASCGISFALPALAFLVALRAWRGIATPLADLMNAADSVAEGDLTVRVPERGPGDFDQLARSFNRMAGELERAEQQRRQMTADIAHELRTPLHIIQGNLEGVLDGVYQPDADHITATLGETRLLARLIDDLRTLSLAEAGQLPLRLESVDVAELLADVETSFSGQAEAAQIDLRVEVPTGPLTITADAGRLDQVIGNLVVNALRHTDPGGSITLRAASNGEGVRITVEDTGVGIPAEDLPYIFDRFWRGDRSRTHVDGVGGGLGLAIARQLIKSHGGQIDVRSTIGEGTTFTIDLPVENHHG